jgi:hypothetical protein
MKTWTYFFKHLAQYRFLSSVQKASADRLRLRPGTFLHSCVGHRFFPDHERSPFPRISFCYDLTLLPLSGFLPKYV